MYQINWGELTPESFLKEYWQKKPLLIKGAFNDANGTFEDPIEADELAGLAMEENIQSRIVGQKRDKTWFVEHGPFTDFSKFGEHYWTLLVQATNNWSAQTHALLTPFRFIPNWRIDDVMVSFSTPKGGVGPHLDQYDVFIIQGEGKRQWQVGTPDESLKTVLPHEDLKQVSPFTPVIDAITEPGDLLYIPPNHPHNGVAIENSLNYSIGFQAPSAQELWSGLVDHFIDNSLAEQRYGDADRTVTSTPESIYSSDFKQLKAFMLDAAQDDTVINHYICKQLTTNYHVLDILLPEEAFELADIDNITTSAEYLSPVLGIKALYNEENHALYIHGEMFEVSLENSEFAKLLAQGQTVTTTEIANYFTSSDNQLLMIKLLNLGFWYLS